MAAALTDGSRMRTEMRIVGHMCDQTIGGSVLRVSGNELLLILALEEVENAGPVSDDFQVGIIHCQLSKSDNATAIIDVSRRVDWGIEGGRMATGIEELDYSTVRNGDASNATLEVWWGCQRSRIQDDIVTHHLHSPPCILVNQLREILSQKMQQAFDRDVSGLDVVSMDADVAVLRRRERPFDFER